MCEIIGYSGNRVASSILISGLRDLEHVCYDSWGIAGIIDGRIYTHKQVGSIEEGPDVKIPNFHVGIAHTRWATQGSVTESNAHPQLSCGGNIAVVQNGILTNFQELREKLRAGGHKFISETDTEVIPHLIEDKMKQGHSFYDAVLLAIKELEGSFAFVALNAKTGELVGVRYLSPLIIGIGKGEVFISSSPEAFVKYTNKAIFLADGDVCLLSNEHVEKITDFNGNIVDRKITKIDKSTLHVDKGHYKHYVIKEIEEQPNVLNKLIDYPKNLMEEAVDALKSAQSVFFVGSGSSYHASLAASYIFSKITKRRIDAIYSSEFRYYKDYINDKTLVIAVSQSGETADVLDAVRMAKSKGATIISILNVEDSTLARQSDLVLPILAGPEVGVASTKTFTAQLGLLVLLAYAYVGRIEEGKQFLKLAISRIKEILSPSEKKDIFNLAVTLKNKKDMFVLGRGIGYPLAMEIALKIKEVSYIHAEGFPAGELKHGPIALIEEGTPVLVIATDDDIRADIIANAEEVNARGAFVVGLSDKNDPVFDHWIPVLHMDEFSPVPSVVLAQLLAYYLAILKGYNPDEPRNLAKAVTVK